MHILEWIDVLLLIGGRSLILNRNFLYSVFFSPIFVHGFGDCMAQAKCKSRPITHKKLNYIPEQSDINIRRYSRRPSDVLTGTRFQIKIIMRYRASCLSRSVSTANDLLQQFPFWVFIWLLFNVICIDTRPPATHHDDSFTFCFVSCFEIEIEFSNW